MTETLLNEDETSSWLAGLFANIFGCAVIILPAALLIRYLKESEKVRRGLCTIIIFCCFYLFFVILCVGSGSFYSLIRLCVLGSGQDTDLERLEEGKEKVEASSSTEAAAAIPTSQYCTKLIACILGLQSSFLVWGLLQVI